MPEDKQINLLKNLIENRHEIYERLAPRVNIVDILGNTYYEVQNSKLLKHAFGEALPEYPTLEDNRRSEFIIIMNENDLKKYNDFAKTVDVNKETE